MNEKVQNIMKKVDAATEKLQILPKLTDKCMEWLKRPMVAGIAPIINKLANRLSGAVIVLFSIIFVLYSLKNAVISMFFKNGPVGLSFGFAAAAIIMIVINLYLIQKMDGVFDNIVTTSTCRISSLNIFAIFSFLSVILAIASFLGGIYLTFEIKEISFLFVGIVALFFFILLALYTSAPADFAVIEDKEASAGEDFMAICSFLLKITLRLTPIIVFVLPIIGICQCVPEFFESYTSSSGDTTYLHGDAMILSMTMLGVFLLVGFVPVVVYFDYLIKYVVLDIIRAVLCLPHKLDELKK